MLRPLLAAAFIAVLTLPVAASGNPVQPELTAKVTARTISLRTSTGERVGVLDPNSYRFMVRDAAKTQNFHLVGPAVNLRTRVPAKTTTSWTVYLKPGTYSYRSDKSVRLRGSFTVRRGPPPA
jgi:hypothetical protein